MVLFLVFFFPKIRSLCDFRMMITACCFVKICITNCSQLTCNNSQCHLFHCQFLKHLSVFMIQSNSLSLTYIVLYAVFPQNGMLMRIPQCIILEIPDALSQWKHNKILTEYFGISSENLHCGNVVNMPYWLNYRILTV